jgi:hypothetical protein
MRNDVAPIIERLVVIFLELFAARLHLDEDAVRPKEVGEFLAAFRSCRRSFDQFQLRRARLLRDAELESRACFDNALVPKCAKETIEKSLSLAFLITLERLGEADKLGQVRFQVIQGHMRYLLKASV